MKVTYGKAIGDALKEEMRRDSKVLIYGEDIAEFGNIFGLTRGMLEEFGPKRVRNTPITETAIIGSAIVIDGPSASSAGRSRRFSLASGLSSAISPSLACCMRRGAR